MSDDILAFLARWALLHELADEAWKAAVERGRAAASGKEGEAPAGGPTSGPDAFLDGLAALVAEEKDALRERLAHSDVAVGGGGEVDTAAVLQEVRFELAEMRAQLESLQTAVDALAHRLDAGLRS